MPPTGQASATRPAVPPKAASLGTHGSLGAEAGGRVEMAFTTSSEPDTGRGRAGDLWILCFHQYCIRRTASPPPPQPRAAHS